MLSVSVVVPCLNGARYLGAALSSALAQDPPPKEIIVQDGGSTDGSAEVVAALDDDRIQFISEPDSGQSDALNRAIRRATGEWIVWLNADDVLAPGLFALADDDVDLVYGDFEWIDENGSPIRCKRPGHGLSVNRLLVEGCFLFSGAVLCRRSLFDRGGDLDVDLHYTMDWDFYLRIAGSTRARYVPRVLGRFRAHSASKTARPTWDIFVETVRVRHRHGGYGSATRWRVLFAQVKQLVNLATLPVRDRMGWP